MSLKKLKAHAKINLTLHIAARRPDGYHGIETVMTPIRLADDLTVAVSDNIEIDCKNKFIPCDERNIAYKAAKTFFEETGITGGASISIDKKIPVCAGLGGGSTDAAAVINALDELYKTGMSVSDKCAIAAKLGSDVPFFIESKTAYCTGRGEILEHIPDHSDFEYAALVWGSGASTAMMYAESDNSTSAYRSSKEVMKALEENDLERLCSGIFNDFEPICNRLRPNTLKLKNAFLEEGAKAACLSGSGAAVFGVFENLQKAISVITALKTKSRD